jgi:Flp pilus assembly protein TadB
MAEEGEPEKVRRPEDPVPPPGEAVHLPGPSYLPVITAAGVAVALVGVVLSWLLVVAGVLVTVIAVTRWVRETREEISELPLEH